MKKVHSCLYLYKEIADLNAEILRLKSLLRNQQFINEANKQLAMNRLLVNDDLEIENQVLRLKLKEYEDEKS